MNNFSIDILSIIFKYTPYECKIINKEFYSCSKSIRIRTKEAEYLTDEILLSLPIHKIHTLILSQSSQLTDISITQLINLHTIVCNDRITDNTIKNLVNLKNIISNDTHLSDEAFINLQQLKILDLRNLCERRKSIDSLSYENALSANMMNMLIDKKVKIVLYLNGKICLWKKNNKSLLK